MNCVNGEEKNGNAGEAPRDFTRELGRALTCLFRSRKKYMGEHLREQGFSGAMYMIVMHLEHHPGATQDSIASHLYIDKCNVARRTKRLEELGYLRRETDPVDRRQNNLYLTDKGREIVPLIKRYLSDWGSSISMELAPEEKETLIALLSKMTGQNQR